MAPKRQGRNYCMSSFVVYILFSDKLGKYYVGQTQDFENRLLHHNTGRTKFTSKGIPWKFVYKLLVDERIEAIRLESKIKRRGIKRFLCDINFFGM